MHMNAALSLINESRVFEILTSAGTYCHYPILITRKLHETQKKSRFPISIGLPDPGNVPSLNGGAPNCSLLLSRFPTNVLQIHKSIILMLYGRFGSSQFDVAGGHLDGLYQSSFCVSSSSEIIAGVVHVLILIRRD
jgi:hypothetical protein